MAPLSVYSLVIISELVRFKVNRILVYVNSLSFTIFVILYNIPAIREKTKPAYLGQVLFQTLIYPVKPKALAKALAASSVFPVSINKLPLTPQASWL